MMIFRVRRLLLPGLCVIPVLAFSALRGAQTPTPEEALERLQASNRHYTAGLEAFEKGEFDKAASALQAGLEKLPQHALASYYLANISYIRKDFSAALDHIEIALANFEAMRALSTLADEQKLKQVDSVRATLERMWDSTNSCRDSRAIEFGEDRLESEEFSLERAARKREEMFGRMKAHYTYFQGNILFQLNLISDAFRCYEEAVRLNPLHADAHNNLIAIAFLAQQYGTAQSLLEKAEAQGLEEALNLELKERLFKALGRSTEGILEEGLTVGEADARLEIRRFALAFRPERPLVSRLYVNSYVAFDPRTKNAVLIDPGVKDRRLEDFVRVQGLSVKAILNTHDHADHTGANVYYSQLFGAPVCAPKDDARYYEVPPDRLLKDGETLAFDGLTIRVLQTPGHTDGSLCFLAGAALFSGDTLFRGDIGVVRSGSPDERAEVRKRLVRSIRNGLLTLPGQTLVCPGHGKTTTIGAEKTSNPVLTK